MTNLSKVGKYEIQDVLGEGAMGVVYGALDPMLNRSVAVKVMNDALALDENFRTRFLREARYGGRARELASPLSPALGEYLLPECTLRRFREL